MSEIKWIKLSTSMFDDEKIKIIESLPDSDTILIIWIKLLSLAGKTNNKGFIFLSENIPFTEEMLSTIFNRPLQNVRFALQTLKQFGMINIDDHDFIYISNWEKHQNVDGMERTRQLTRQRVAKHRENQKVLAAPNDVTLHETLRNGTDIDIDKELDKEKDIYIDQFNEFWSIYPRKEGKKKSQDKFKKVLKTYSFEQIMNGTKKYIEYLYKTKTQKQFIKQPLTFLNGEHFNDEFTGGPNGKTRFNPDDNDLPF
ncbi:phage replisome organizer N-terminal domain-containing protein [Gottfriedia acidiceleris]|uniref:phage replisome organizer N-terminal domain-containing protein n=1 Tax=Gottfriedia acidiceleris TaxID=371036 RepID=UPI00101E1B39|nr:phage replisome organizer N-terminal domain-containing protein [Gottfriedia acidiceleris]